MIIILICSANQTIKSKLGQVYLKLAEFLIPGYDLERMVEESMPIVREVVVKEKEAEEPASQIIVKEVTQVKQVTHSYPQIVRI